LCRTSDRLIRWLPALLLAAHAGLLLNSIRLHSVTIDEAGHIPSGLVHWHAGTFGAYRVNPPLPRMLATLPLLATKCQWVDEGEWAYRGPHSRVEGQLARSFRQFNQERYRQYVVLARLAGVLWSCLGGWLVFRWGRDLYGFGGGLLGLAVWCFEPNILAHAQLATPDLPCSVAALLAGYVFWLYLKTPAWEGAVIVGMTLGLALLTKFTLVVLLPVEAVLLLAWMPAWRGRELLVRLAHASAALVVMLLVVNAGYMFEGSGKRLGDIPFISRSFAGTANTSDSHPAAQEAGNRFRDSWLGRLPVPLPEDWLRGIDVQRRDFEIMPQTRPSYLAGQWKHGGWWYYYLYALGVKLPVGVIALMLAGFVLAVIRHRCAAGWRDELAVYLPAMAVLAFVSSQTGFNHHMRYVLPAFPFLMVGTGKLAWFLANRRWLPGGVVIAALLWGILSGLAVYPHSLSYFNEIAGGPLNGHAHLLDSNIDWGQDSLFLERWLDEHPEARPMHLALFGPTPRNLADEPLLHPPPGPAEGAAQGSGPQPGYYAISVNALRGMNFRGASGLEYFQRFEPIARAGYTIYVYHLSRQDCDRLRTEMGLPPVTSP
jgi:hypothetical protein